MAQELKQTKSEIYTEAPTFLKKSEFIATIGDICTIKIIEEIRIPDLMIVDYIYYNNIYGLILNSSQLLIIFTKKKLLIIII